MSKVFAHPPHVFTAPWRIGFLSTTNRLCRVFWAFEKMSTRWFKPWPFHPLIGGHLTISKGHLPSQKGHKELPGRFVFCFSLTLRIMGSQNCWFGDAKEPCRKKNRVIITILFGGSNEWFLGKQNLLEVWMVKLDINWILHHFTWVFPKIMGTPKWMVYNGKPY